MQYLKMVLLVAAWLLLVPPLIDAQEQSAEPSETERSEPPGDDTADADDAEDVGEVPDTDDESYRDIDDKDFRPSEDIPADQAIAFPTDI